MPVLLDFIVPRYGQGWTGLIVAFPVMVFIVFMLIRMRTYEPMALRWILPALAVLSAGWTVSMMTYSEVGLIISFVAFIGYTGYLLYRQNQDQ